MNSVDRVKSICKERGIPLSRIEKDLGFSNGYIGQLKKGFPDARLQAVAKYLEVSPEYLITGSGQKEKPSTTKGAGPAGYDQLTPENQRVVDALIAALAAGQSSK